MFHPQQVTRRLLPWLAVLLALLVSGCAGTIVRSDVTAFHEWQPETAEKTFSFSRDAAQANDLEYRSYENLVRAELQRLGFAESERPRLKVSLGYQVDARDMRVVEPVIVDPWYGPGFFGRHRYPYGFYSPFADPFWFGPPVVQPVERRFVLYSRQLKITIGRVNDGRNLYQVTVNSQGQTPSLAAVMPAMVRSAFTDFPGPSGVPRVLEVRVDPPPR
jgi:hypothetical protein